MQITLKLDKDEVIQDIIENNFNPDIMEAYSYTIDLIAGLLEDLEVKDEDISKILKITEGDE